MLKIGEFSKLSRVSIRMLRHYDDIGLLKPADPCLAAAEFLDPEYKEENSLLSKYYLCQGA
nr:MerR family DNA-binding transcriptional regulator [Butyrivibrio sp. WCE2006]